MNAKEAREIALQKCKEEFELQKDIFESHIEEYAKKGEFVVRYCGSVRQDVREYLETQGFELHEVKDDPNEYTTIITW
jgi:glutamate synthase domain-containing protein 2